MKVASLLHEGGVQTALHKADPVVGGMCRWLLSGHKSAPFC